MLQGQRFPVVPVAAGIAPYLAVAFRRHDLGNPVAESGADILYGIIRILHDIVQDSRRQEFLVWGHGSDDSHRFQGMDDVWKAFPATFGTRMSPGRKQDSPVQ